MKKMNCLGRAVFYLKHFKLGENLKGFYFVRRCGVLLWSFSVSEKVLSVDVCKMFAQNKLCKT